MPDIQPRWLSPEPADRPMRLLRMDQVLERVPVSQSLLYVEMREGRFPPARQVSSNVVAWLESEVEAWIAALATVALEKVDPEKRGRGRPRKAA